MASYSELNFLRMLIVQQRRSDWHDARACWTTINVASPGLTTTRRLQARITRFKFVPAGRLWKIYQEIGSAVTLLLRGLIVCHGEVGRQAGRQARRARACTHTHSDKKLCVGEGAESCNYPCETVIIIHSCWWFSEEAGCWFGFFPRSITWEKPSHTLLQSHLFPPSQFCQVGTGKSP